MPSNATILFQFGGFPEGYCPTSYQTLGNDFAAALTGYLPGAYITVLTGDTEPAAIDRDKPWFRSDGRWYSYSAPGLGEWVSKHPLAPGTIVMGFFAAEADIWAFDGGDGSNPSSVTPTGAIGAMWEKVAAFDGRVPLGVGTLTASGTTVASGGTGGSDQTTIVSGNLPPHQHTVPVYPSASTPILDTYGTVTAPSTGRNATPGSSTISVFSLTNNGPNETITTQTAMNTVSPYVGVYFIRRTNRLWYTT